jgi:hypothetical protein
MGVRQTRMTSLVENDVNTLPPGYENTSDIWLPLPDESSKHYGAFKVYLDLGYSRNFDESYRVTYAKGTHQRAPAFFRKWAHKFRWEERARARDEYMARQQHDAQVLATREKAGEQAVDALRAYQDMLRAGAVVLERADLPSLDEVGARRLLRAAVTLIDAGAKGTHVETRLQAEHLYSSLHDIEAQRETSMRIFVARLAVGADELIQELGEELRWMQPAERTEVIDAYIELTKIIKRLSKGRTLPTHLLALTRLPEHDPAGEELTRMLSKYRDK